MQPLLTAEESRKADSYTTTQLGVPELVLMEHAALAVEAAICRRFARLLDQIQVLVLVGPGHNGADGLAVARLLHHRGVRVRIAQLLVDKRPSESFRTQLKMVKAMGIPISDRLTPADVVVDGIFGTGLAREITGDLAKSIAKLNSTNAWVVSIDIPSGVCSDTGRVLGTAVRAHKTVTFGYYKRGLVTGAAVDYVGDIEFATIQIPREIPKLNVTNHLFEIADARALLPERKPTSHKGSFGHVGVVLGQREMWGAALHAASGAIASGAGLVSVLCSKDALVSARSFFPADIMLREFSLEAITSIVVGPGMGNATQGWEAVKTFRGPMVVDADAIALFAGHKNCVLTPHPKEAARFLGVSVDEVQANRFDAAEALAKKSGATVLLKGKGTIVRSQGASQVITQGNSALARGGTGDVLSGVIGGFLAQQLKPSAAASLGAYVHGRAAEIAAQVLGSERAIAAAEVPSWVARVFAELES